MSALGKLTGTETKLFLRDPGAVITTVAVPVGLLLVFGLMPGINKPDPQFGGHSPLATLIAPISIAVLLGMLALNVLPTYLATYREKGILRRLSASPVHPSNLLTAQLLVQLAAAAVVVLIVVGVGTVALGMPAPGNLVGFLISLVLGIASLFSVGLLVAAVAPSGRAATGIGMAAFFPMLALGGVWVPKEQLPVFMQHVADVLPLGATLNSLRETWAGNSPEVLQLLAMVAFAVVAGALATRLFRWE
ncbi:MAG: ABC transporter permease [Sciscionella sp.]